MKNFPFVPDELLKKLEEIFPDKACRKPNVTQIEVGVMIGRQDVMDILRREHQKQNIMEG